MPYFPTTTNTPKAILASAGSVTWLLGGLAQGSDPNAVQDVVGEPIVAGASMPCSPTMNAGRSVNTYSVQSYFLGGGAATVVLQGSMTNRDADFVTLTAVNGVYQTNLPFIRAVLSAITAGSVALAVIY
jgi:hypothetical protein